MYYKRIIKLFACTMLAVTLLMTGCSTTKTDSSSDGAATTEASGNENTSSNTDSTDKQGTKPVMGKITKIDGKKITIALVSNEGMKQPDNSNGDSKPDGTPSTDQSEDKTDSTPPPMPSDDANSDESSENKQAPQMELSGETKTITVTDDTKITINQESKTISDLKTDDMIQVTMDGDTVTEITSGMGGGRGQGQGKGQTKQQDSEDSSSSN